MKKKKIDVYTNRSCKKCKEEKIRIRDGKYPDGKHFKWRDNENLLWNGFTCGSCHAIKSRGTMRKIREK